MLFRRLGLGVAAGLVALVGAGFLLAAAVQGLERVFHPPAAAAIVGGALVLLATILLVAALRRGPVRRRFAVSDVAVAALGLAVRLLRDSPGKALIAAVVAGLLSEWLGERESGEKAKRTARK